MPINLSKQQIIELESLAELQFSAEECATILEIDPGAFTREMESYLSAWAVKGRCGGPKGDIRAGKAGQYAGTKADD